MSLGLHDIELFWFLFFPGGAAVKNLCVMQEVWVHVGLTPGWGRSPGEGNGTPLQYSCLENPIDRETWEGYSPWGLKRVGHYRATKQ